MLPNTYVKLFVTVWSICFINPPYGKVVHGLLQFKPKMCRNLILTKFNRILTNEKFDVSCRRPAAKITIRVAK